jgi:GntR family transcriptional regulator/MocR family aminotransferase
MTREYSNALPNLTALDRASGVALRTQLYQQLRDAILSGRLAPGSRLPSTRDLAADLDVSRNTALDAFNQLVSEGYLEGQVGDGTYVSRHLPDDLFHADRPAPRERRKAEVMPSTREGGVDIAPITAAEYLGKPRPFRTGTPALDAFPFQTWSRLLARRWRQSGRDLLAYGEAAGYLPLREAIAAYLRTTRGVRCSPEQLILTSGSQHALEIAARVLLAPGDEVWLEDPGFLGARAAFLSAGAHITPVPIDDEGMVVESGIEQSPHARLAYVTPSHQYPLGPTLTLRRRLALLRWASRTGAWIVEDDYDSEFRYAGRPLPALQGIDAADRVIYVGTFSKVLFPSIRTGYLVAPPELVPAFTAGRSLSGQASAPLDHAVLRDFLTEGHFARHLRRMRVIYAKRQRALVNAAREELAGLLDVSPGDAGMHLIGWLPAGTDDRLAARAAAGRNVETTPLSAYCIQPPARAALRLGYTGYTPKQIWEGVRALAGALRSLLPSAGL